MSLSAILNMAIILILGIGVIIWLLYTLFKKPGEVSKKKSNTDMEHLQLKEIQYFVSSSINNFISTNLLDLGLSEEEYNRRNALRTELQSALKFANTGDIKEKIYIKQYIFDLLNMNYGITDQNIDWIIPFEDVEKLTDQDQFEILLYMYKKEYGFKALGRFIEDYDLARPKFIIEDGQAESFIITPQEIQSIYRKNMHKLLEFDDKLNIIVQRIYQNYKGFGVIDEIRDMAIDGVSGGASGIPESMQVIEDEMELMHGMKSAKKDGYNSIWIFYRGKSVHLSFLTFGDEAELKRICQNIYKYDNPGQLTESNGYMVNDMKDGSRVVVVRPPMSESWAFWVRKFDTPNIDLSKLINDESAVNAELARDMTKFLMKGERTTAFTGQQGTGKTTLAMAAIKFISAVHNLRIQELAFELNLRRLYPSRNTIAFRETQTVSGSEALDVQKKTDGAVNILGEVATDEVAAWAVKMGTVASRFTLFTAHPRTFEDLIFYLRNALVNKKYFTDQRSAEEQVAKVVEYDVHLEKDHSGKRYIERITECTFIQHNDETIGAIQQLANNADSVEDQLKTLVAVQLEELKHKTMRPWKAHNIVEYRNGEYVAAHPPSAEKVRSMLSVMSEKDGQEFRRFLKKHWEHVNYG